VPAASVEVKLSTDQPEGPVGDLRDSVVSFFSQSSASGRSSTDSLWTPDDAYFDEEMPLARIEDNLFVLFGLEPPSCASRSELIV
jgi:hypothetical protein